jgi:hypothetical protein
MLAKRPAESLPPMFGENINCGDLSVGFGVGILIAGRNEVAKSGDAAVRFGNKDVTGRLQESLLPEGGAAFDVERGQSVIGYPR